MAFYRSASIYKLNDTRVRVRVGVEMDMEAQKMVDIGVEVPLSLVKALLISSFLLTGERLWQVHNPAISLKINYKTFIFSSK